ncbi:hypothetical protein [Chryseobacterium edaphi]|uniref:hypothetical protein n=1 Tax=Chryseobacterium edaphi TaxID=2976532 RepID=UPI0021D5D8BE|nr:hypothetical protein [Chryseobacterium edaphi]
MLLFFTVISCSKKDFQRIRFRNFDIAVPTRWKKIELSGIDSNVGGLLTENNDTIVFDYGPHSNSLEETPNIYDRKFLNEILKAHPDIDTTEMIIVNDISKIEPENYKINYSYTERLSGYQAKIVYPKKAGKGITGIYIDSIGHSSLGKIEFNLYAENLNIEDQKALLKAIKTIHFKK